MLLRLTGRATSSAPVPRENETAGPEAVVHWVRAGRAPAQATQPEAPPVGTSAALRPPIAGLERLSARVREALGRADLALNIDPHWGHLNVIHTHGGLPVVVLTEPPGTFVRGGSVSSEGRIQIQMGNGQLPRHADAPVMLTYDPVRHDVRYVWASGRAFRAPLPLGSERLLAIRAALVSDHANARDLGRLRTIDPGSIDALRALFRDGPESVLASRSYVELARDLGANRLGTALGGFAFVNPNAETSTVHNELFHSSFYDHEVAAFREARPGATPEQLAAFERERLDRPSYYDDFKWPYEMQARTNIQANELGSDAVSMQVDAREINRLLLLRTERSDPNHQYYLTTNYAVSLVTDLNRARRSGRDPASPPLSDEALTRILNSSATPLDDLKLSDAEIAHIRSAYLALARRIVIHSRNAILSRHR